MNLAVTHCLMIKCSKSRSDDVIEIDAIYLHESLDKIINIIKERKSL